MQPKPEAITIPTNVRALLDAPNDVHLTTLRRDGRPRSWVVWVGLEGERVLVCSTDHSWKSGDMRNDARGSLSVVTLRFVHHPATTSTAFDVA